MPSIDPKQMEQMMRQMGIKTRNLPAKRVIIETEENRIIVNDPQVTEVTAAGQVTFQIGGNITKETAINEEDVKLVMEQAGASQEDAAKTLKETNGDIAEAILKLKK